MLEAGMVIVSPRGTRVEILENSGQRIAIKRALPPLTGGTKAKAHRHTASLETFELLDGEATGWVGGRECKLKPGDRIEIPLGATHVNPYTTAGNSAVLVQTVSPRARGVEVYFTSWLDWLAQGKADASEEPSLLQVAAIVKEGGMAGTWASGYPVWLQRVGLPIVGSAVGLVGLRATRLPHGGRRPLRGTR